MTAARLGEIWPAASRRLLRVLELRGLDRANAEDLVQEVGVRAIQVGVTFDGLDDFLWWAMPVVRNLHIDLIRASKWSVAAAEVPDREAVARVEHVVERRLALQSVLQHLSAMPAADREAIVSAATDAPVDPSRRGTVAVRRHRARAHLRRVVGTALGLTGAGAFLRRLRATGATLSPVTAAAYVALPALVYGVGHAPARPVEVRSGRAHVVTFEPSDTRRVAARTTETAGRAVAPARVAAPVVRAATDAPARPAPTVVEVKPVQAHGVRAEHRESAKTDPLVCVFGGARVGTHCVESPVRANVTVRGVVR